MFIDKEYCYIKSTVGMDQYAPTDRHMSFCTWTLVPVNPEILVRPIILNSWYASKPCRLTVAARRHAGRCTLQDRQ